MINKLEDGDLVHSDEDFSFEANQSPMITGVFEEGKLQKLQKEESVNSQVSIEHDKEFEVVTEAIKKLSPGVKLRDLPDPDCLSGHEIMAEQIPSSLARV